MATSQQIADEILHHWQLLWPLPASERLKRIDDIKQDYQFEETLQCVQKEMADV